MRTITVWQNVDFEDAAAIGEWAKSRGYKLETILAYDEAKLSATDELIVLGGPMSVYGNKPFIIREKEALKSHINSGKKVFGICLGAQLIADALGAKVFAGNSREAGWRDVTFVQNLHFEGFGPNACVFHWHGDTFELPKNTIRLAYNDAYENQAFCTEDFRIIATQFHFESIESSICTLLANDLDYLNSDSKFVQSKEEILSKNMNIQNVNNLLFKLLDNWIEA